MRNVPNFMRSILLAGSLLATGLLCTSAVAKDGHDDKNNNKNGPPLVLADQGFFYVGGRYVTLSNNTHIMADQMYVHYEIPKDIKHKYPIVMVHGGLTAGLPWEQTPDGRDGWATYFAKQGYAVYVVDQCGIGRSAFQTQVYGALGNLGTAEDLTARFTAPQLNPLWPQAHLHTQWPGAGVMGDKIFDGFYAGEEANGSPNTSQRNQAALAALVDRIGPIIIFSHSQSGPYPYLLADVRPGAVKAIVGIEPSHVFGTVALIGPPTWFQYPTTLDNPWGLTNIPITYDPPITDPAQLGPVLEPVAQSPDLARCYRQSEPAHKLPRLKGIPILITVGEASFHAPTDHCTSQYLTQAGVQNDFVRLEQHGIHGTGHFQMLEKNSLQIADLIARWLALRIDKRWPVANNH